MTTKRTGEPWMTADAYGRGMPCFTVNLIVRDIALSVVFYQDVLGAQTHYSDPDFAALSLAGLEYCLHADHAYDQHPWHARLADRSKRGLGAELRLLGVNPDEVEARARKAGAEVLQIAMDKPHGWRDVVVEDPDGYAWAIGVTSATVSGKMM